MRLVLALSLAALSAWYASFVVSGLWGWFIVPFGVVPLDKAWSLGLLAIAGILCKSHHPDKDTSVESIFNAFLFTILKISLFGGMGFVAHLLM